MHCTLLLALLLSIKWSLALSSQEVEDVTKAAVSHDADDETPLAYIKTWAALGDSYVSNTPGRWRLS
jgi:hypothetical protein